MMERFEGKVTLVTGGGCGIGAARLVQGLSRDLGERGITINHSQPGLIDTEIDPNNSETAEILKKLMVACLAGLEASYVTGASLTNDGGAA
jgi:NAD(P)-dependent dehydrogenase (short-subunit alcohol dehydrogenase family)